MPTPRKNEAKQDYLKRCTGELIKKENRSPEQAYKLCNVYWDNAKGQKSAMNFTAPIELKDAEEGRQRGGFLITAYTGKVVQRFWSKLVIAVKGITANGKMPILREHIRDRVVGWSVKSWPDGNFYIMGEFSESSKDGQEVRALAEEGFPWQASIGVWPVKVKVLESEKEEETVNGQKIKGPAEIWLESEVREVSFVTIGADSDTAAIAMAESEDRKVPVEIITNSVKETETMEITIDILKAEAPDLLKQIRDEARQEGFSDGKAQGIEEGQSTERERVTKILSIEDADLEAKQKAVTDGLSVDASYKLFYEAEKQKKDDKLDELKAETPKSVGQQAKEKENPSEPDFMAEVDAYQKEKGCSRTEALKAVSNLKPELHQAWLDSQKK